MIYSHLAPHIVDRIDHQLLPDEEVLWADYPRDSSLNGCLTVVRVVFFTIGLLISVFVLVSIGALEALCVLAFYGMVGLAYYLSYQKANSIYIVTDKRALIIAGLLSRTFEKQDLQFITRKMRSDTTGDLIFAYRGKGTASVGIGPLWMEDVSFSANGFRSGFLNVENVRDVEALIMETFHPM